MVGLVAVLAAGAAAFAATGGHVPGLAAPPTRPAGRAHLPGKAHGGSTQTAPKVAAGAPTTTKTTAPPPSEALLRVAAQDQWPALPNGCEVTSLSMLLGAVGHPVSNLRLAHLVTKDPTPRVMKHGQILSWGNPNRGFVGDMWVHATGFGVYHGPIAQLVNRILPGRAVDMTGMAFSRVLDTVGQGTPVEVWSTIPLSPNVPWVTWQSPEGPVRTTMDEHAVLIVGYSPTTVYINNPFNGKAAEAVPRPQFEASWRVMGKQAVTVRGLAVAAADRCTGGALAACLPPTKHA